MARLEEVARHDDGNNGKISFVSKVCVCEGEHLLNENEDEALETILNGVEILPLELNEIVNEILQVKRKFYSTIDAN